MSIEKITEDFDDNLRATNWLNPDDPAAVILDEPINGKRNMRVVQSGYGAISCAKWCELEQKRIGADKVRIVQDGDGRIALVRVAKKQEQ